MTVRWISTIFDAGPADKSERLVMLALADYANDEGECWPSIAGICRKSALKERGVQGILRRLEAAGWLEIETGGGRRNCNLYRLKVPEAQDETQQSARPAAAAPQHSVAHTPQGRDQKTAGDAPEPSDSPKKPSKPDPVFDLLAPLAQSGAVRSFLAYRRQHRAKGLSVTGAKRLAAALELIQDQGGDPSEALALAEERGWASVQADWYFKATGKTPVTNESSAVCPDHIRSAKLKSIARGIQAGRAYLYQSASHSDVMAAVAAKLITKEQASAAGFR